MTNGSFQTCWVVELLSILMKIPWFVSVFLDFHHEGNKFVFETYHEKTQKQICYMVDTTLEYLQRFLKTRHEQHFKLKLVSLTAGSEFTKHQEINRSNGISDLIGGVQNIVCYIYSNPLICAHVLWISFLLNAWKIGTHSETVSASARAFWNATSGYVIVTRQSHTLIKAQRIQNQIQYKVKCRSVPFFHFERFLNKIIVWSKCSTF